jgi:hypothetical protein
LGKSATGTGAKHYDPEHSVSPRAAASADLGAGVAVDFERERNLNDLGCLPGHGHFLIASPAQRRRCDDAVSAGGHQAMDWHAACLSKAQAMTASHSQTAEPWSDIEAAASLPGPRRQCRFDRDQCAAGRERAFFGRSAKEDVMPQNVGDIDKWLRIIAGVLILGLGAFGPLGWWGLLGIVPLATGLMGYCPAYSLIGMNTCQRRM